MRAEKSNGLLELVAGATPAHLAIREVPLVAVREAEMLADLGDPVELIFRQVFRQPVASVVGEIEFLGHRVPVKANRVAHPGGGHFGAAAVEVDAPYLPVGRGWLANIARRADVHVELVVRPQAYEFPAVRLAVED